MSAAPSNIDTVLSAIDTPWTHRILAQVNDHDVRLVRVLGEFVWHSHPDSDELFIVLDGEFEIALRLDGTEHTVQLGRHDAFTVPRGVEHRPRSEAGAAVMLIEPTGLLNTGDFDGDLPEGITTTSGRPI